MVDAFGGSRVKIKPPERGVFPLDHDGECKVLMKNFLVCLKKNDADHFPCRSASADYLKCRMDKDLMAVDDLSKLGLGETGIYERKIVNEGEKEGKGFIAGIGVKSSKKGFFK